MKINGASNVDQNVRVVINIKMKILCIVHNANRAK